MSPLITIVIPCFNEAHRLSHGPFVSFLDDVSDLCFLFVDDGSTDHTAEKLDKISSLTGSKSSVLKFSENRGKLRHYCEIPVIFTHHPRELLHDQSLKKETWEDLKSHLSLIKQPS